MITDIAKYVALLIALAFIPQIIMAQDSIATCGLPSHAQSASEKSNSIRRQIFLLSRAYSLSHIADVIEMCELYHEKKSHWPQTIDDLAHMMRAYLPRDNRMAPIKSAFRSLTLSSIDTSRMAIKFDAFPFTHDSVSYQAYGGTFTIGIAPSDHIENNIEVFKAYDQRNRRQIEYLNNSH